MAGVALINGEKRTIKYGMCKIDGTNYKITRGVTTIDGTRYYINFGEKTVINVTKGTTFFNDTYIQINEGENISSTQTLEFEAGENVILFAYAAGLGPAFPGIITINGKEVGRAEDTAYSMYEFDCTGNIVNVIINDYNYGSKMNGTIDITTDDA